VSAPRASHTSQQVQTYAECRAALGGEQEGLELLKAGHHGAPRGVGARQADHGEATDEARLELPGLPSRDPCRRQEQQRDLHEHEEREERSEGNRDDLIAIEAIDGGRDGGEGRGNEPRAAKHRAADERLAEQKPVVLQDRADDREASDDGGRGHGHAGEKEEPEKPSAARRQAAATVATAGRAHGRHY
jgi:hypothetical protein